MLVKLDLQRFAEDELLDLESELAEFEAEWNEEEVEEVEEVPEPEEKPEEEPPQADPNDEDEHRRNQAFAQLREEAEANKKYADFINRLAQEAGVSSDEILARYEERNLQAEADKQQVPLEFFKESRETANRLTQLEENMRAERIDAQIEAAKAKYGADDDSIRETFSEMLRSGVDPRVQDNVDFEKWYRAANLETIIQKEVENARQKDLDDKKKRQESASIGNGTSVSPSSGELSDDEFDELLAKMDIKL